MRTVRRAAALTLLAALAPAAARAQNRALNQPAFASSIFDGSHGPERAVDGSTQGNHFAPNGIFHSGNSGGDWWYVDLGQTYAVSGINVWNRTDCCTGRLAGAILGLFTAVPYQGASPAPIWSTSLVDQTLQSFTPGASGRYVGVRAVATGDHWLQLAEVEVFGTTATPGVLPEPSTWAMLAGGLLAVGAVARRRGARRG